MGNMTPRTLAPALFAALILGVAARADLFGADESSSAKKQSCATSAERDAAKNPDDGAQADQSCGAAKKTKAVAQKSCDSGAKLKALSECKKKSFGSSNAKNSRGN
jgi:hypothetical protein